MDFKRVVQVRVAGRDGGTSFGSGYVIADRLVLTAGHVLGADGVRGPRSVTVSSPDRGGERCSADVVWSRRDDQADAALVEITDERWAHPGGQIAQIQRWGRLATNQPQCPVTARGFPRLQKDAAGRWHEQLAGWINPGTGDPARLEVLSRDPLPGDLQAVAAGTPWSGMSGAAVFHGGLLVGVIRQDRRARDGTRLTATASSVLLADDGFARILTARTGWRPLAEPVELEGLFASAVPERAVLSPAMVLRADVEAVAFHGRERERAHLLDWCLAQPDGASAMAVVAPGGQGKTRLARWLCAELAERGWATGFLRPDITDIRDQSEVDLSALARMSTDVLLVVDYCETRPHQVRRIVEYARSARRRICVLLLARAVGGWKTEVLDAGTLVHEILSTAPVLELGPLSDPSARREQFDAVLPQIAALLGKVAGYCGIDWTSLTAAVPPPAGLAQERYATALTLQMAALAGLLQAGPAPAQAPRDEPLEATLLRHEAVYWARTAAAPEYGLGHLASDSIRRAVAAAVLFGAADQAEALRTVGSLPGIPADRRESVAEWLRRLYPAPDEVYWGALQPDRVAEFHAAAAVTEAVAPGFLIDLFASAATPQRIRAATVLARAAALHANAGRRTAGSVVLDHLVAVLGLSPLNLQELEAVRTALPESADLLADFALRLRADLTAVYRRLAAADPQHNEPELAWSLSRLSVRLGDVGQRTAALDAAEEAVSICRRLAADDPQAHEATLVLLLGDLFKAYNELGRHAEALAAIEESAALERQRSARDPAADRKPLARALTNLSIALADVGRIADGLAAVEEAVTIHRQLAQADPEAHERSLAVALNTLANRRITLGQGAQAQIPAEESVAIFRRRALAAPDSGQADLAASLIALSTCRADAGHELDALATIEEATGVYRNLAQNHPQTYDSSLANCVHNLSNRLWTLGRRTEALDALLEAIALRRKLSETAPEAHQADLAASLHNLSLRYDTLERPGDALDAVNESIALYRERSEANWARYSPDLALTLSDLSFMLADTGDAAQALPIGAEALAIRRRLAAANPEKHRADLALGLHDYAALLSDLNRDEEVLAPREQATALYRQLAAADSDTYDSDLADSLYRLAIRLDEAGRHDEALSAATEAVALHRRLAANDPDQYEPDLALALLELSNLLDNAWRTEQALTPCEEALAIGRRLAATAPETHDPFLAHTLHNYAVVLSRLDRDRESFTAREQATALYRQLAAADPDTYNSDLADSLYRLAVHLDETGRHDEALSAAAEAVGLYRSLAATAPDEYRDGLASALYECFLGREATHRPAEEVFSVLTETTELYHALVDEDPDAYLDHLGVCLNHASITYSRYGDLPASRAAVAEAAALYRQQNARDPETYRPRLALTLYNLSLAQADLDEHDEALNTIEECSSLFRALAQGEPDTRDYQEGLGRSLLQTAWLLHRTGNAATVATAREAVSLIGPLAATSPDDLRTDLLLAAAQILGEALYRQGNRQEAAEIAKRYGIKLGNSGRRPWTRNHNTKPSMMRPD